LIAPGAVALLHSCARGRARPLRRPAARDLRRDARHRRAVGRRRHPGDAVEGGAERAEALEADLEADLADAELGVAQELLGALDPARLGDTEVFHLACALRGWHVTPRAAANTGPIDARVWLAAALASGGRYRAPDADGHPADLRDGGPLVDSIVLMAVVQRHLLD